MSKALEGVRILDLTQVLGGPFCTSLLADMGAEVIKIENPEKGDPARDQPNITINGESYYFMALNRGKKSITINLKDEKGVEIFNKLVEIADVVVENFRPGVMEKLGISYPILKEINSKIIFASISGFGKKSPFEHLPAYDIVAQAMGGIMSITGHPDDPPTRVGVSLGDTAAGVFTAFAISTALYARKIHGVGQFIDVSMVDSIFALLESNLLRYLAHGVIPGRVGSRHPLSYPYDAFKAADGDYIIATRENIGFGRVCKAIGRPELLSLDRFSDDRKRGENAKELKAIIEDWSSTLTVEEVLRILEKELVPAGPIFNIKQIAESEHIKVREMLVEVEHPIAGKIRIPGVPVKLSETPGKVEAPPPLLGQHTDEILTGLLGYHKEEIQRLRNSKVI
jgi:crotonobetainyl-CoA:carnitine CoA-transferase CaiB-like acyl-CoA transferase